MDIRMPDGVLLTGIPEGTSKADIMAKYNGEPPVTNPYVGHEMSSIEDSPYLSTELPRPSDNRSYQRQLLSNIPRSAKKLARDLAQPVMHPLDTVRGLKDLAKGVYSKALEEGMPEEQAVDAAIDFYKDRYGSLDRVADTVKEDPIGAYSDIAGAIGTFPGKVGKLARATDPINMVTNLTVSPLTNQLLKKSNIPEDMVESATKFSTTLGSKERSALVKTMIDEQIMPTSRGLDKLSNRLEGLDVEIDNLVNLPDNSDVYFLPSEIARGIPDLMDDLGGTTHLDSAANRKAIKAVKDNFMHDKEMIAMTTPELQEFKKNAYKDINYDRDTYRGSSRATVEAQKELARGAKELLEELVPDIKGANKIYGELLELRPNLERSAARISNRDFIGLGTPSKVAAGALAGSVVNQGASGGIMGLISGLLDAPTVKAKLGLELGASANRPLIEQLLDTNTRTGVFAREANQLVQDNQNISVEDQIKLLEEELGL